MVKLSFIDYNINVYSLSNIDLFGFFGMKEGSEWRVIFFPLLKKQFDKHTGEVSFSSPFCFSVFFHVCFCCFS